MRLGRAASICTAVFAVAAAIVAITGLRAGASESGQPSPETTLRLSSGAYLHIQSLPLGVMPGDIVGDASFDAAGSRAVFVAVFAGAALYGNPSRMNPSQAFVFDLHSRVLTQLTSDGFAASARWSGGETVTIRDGDSDETIALTPSAAHRPLFSSGHFRLSVDQSVAGDLNDVSPPDSDRLSVLQRSDGTYVIRQIGAHRRVEGVASNGDFALIGDSIAWIDADESRTVPLLRAGAMDAIPPRFDDAYGRMLKPIAPLGRTVYQGAYRDGVAYFVFSYGLTRVVAATRDFVTYSYPPRPSDPAYSVGDGFGALSDGRLYFAWPEGLALTVQRATDYETLSMTFPQGYSDVQPLIAAVAAQRPSSALRPALQPDSDALDAALLQWRVYPAGVADGMRWIASYLGRVYIGDAGARFVRAAAPAFPFALLSRTDDGALWGASYAGCASASVACTAVALLWSSHDGTRWRVRYALDGSPGAVGATAGSLWAAETKSNGGGAMLYLTPLGGDANPASYPTGATYAGEQLFFAETPAGTYLIWGSTPGRSAGGEGTLSAFRIDRAQLTAQDRTGSNVYSRVRSASSSPSAFTGFGDPAMLDSTVSELRASSAGREGAVLATDIADPIAPAGVILRTLDDEMRWETEFGSQPEPLGVVSARLAGADAIVTRAIWRAPLRGDGATEVWRRDAGGDWRWERTLRSWEL